MIPITLKGVRVTKTPERAERFDQVEIGQRMRRAREAAGLSRAALGRDVGLSDDALRKKESGENPFYLPEISRICDRLGAPSLFPFMDWGEARLADKLLGREPPTNN